MPQQGHSPTGQPSDILLGQALERAARKAKAGAETAPREADPRERVFPGNMPPPVMPEGTARREKPRARTKRRVSPFTVVVGLILTAVASVLYISNVIAVSQLAAEIGKLEEEYGTILNEQEMVRAQIARLSGLERIRRIAEEEYGMQYSGAVPGWLTVDPTRVEELGRISERAGVER